jgi:hypothetical protein
MLNSNHDIFGEVQNEMSDGFASNPPVNTTSRAEFQEDCNREFALFDNSRIWLDPNSLLLHRQNSV